MKKRNFKGFTLVELVVVMAIMVIIMGAVMSILKPVNNYYLKINNTTEQESICIATGDALSDNLKYARYVSVSFGTAYYPGSSYNKCIVIDNSNTSARPESKQHGQGTIKIYDVNSSGTLQNERYISGFDQYSNATYDVTISEFSTDVGTAYVKFDFKAYPMKTDAGSYVPNTEIVYQYSKSIEFTNINNKNQLKSHAGELSFNSSSITHDTDQNLIYIYYATADQDV